MNRHDMPTYHVWCAMKARCRNPNSKDYSNYGARGITYDPKWETFEGFVEDMGVRKEIVEGELTLERKDNNKNYCKDNCAWVTRAEQNRNQRLRKDNSAGLKGVRYDKKRQAWAAYGSFNGVRTNLYWGTDFFEACCRRKSWEAKVNRDANAALAEMA